MQNNKVLFVKISKIVTNLENNVADYTVYCGKKSMFVEKIILFRVVCKASFKQSLHTFFSKCFSKHFFGIIVEGSISILWNMQSGI